MTGQTFMGMPLHIATPEQIRMAVMFGRFLRRDEAAAYYDYDGKLWVLPNGDPGEYAQPDGGSNGQG
jgi:hypothetical protein